MEVQKDFRDLLELLNKAVSHKLARASYYVMRDGVDYDEARLFV